MQTIITDSVDEAAAYLRGGQLVAFPTETVYGLGADAFNQTAVRHIFEAKDRPADNPLIVHIAYRRQVAQLCGVVPQSALALMDHFFPGPLTIILPRREDVPIAVSAGLDTVGVRMPRHPVASAFLRACDTPVAAPSANRSGRPSPTTWEAVHEDMDERIRCILRGERSEVGLESTVVDCTVGPPVVLRAGAIALEELQEINPEIRASDDPAGAPPRSPGQRYRHYSPRARVVLVTSGREAVTADQSAYIGLVSRMEGMDRFHLVELCENVEAYAYALYDFFRRCDAEGIETIYCQRVPETGLGTALMDRLQRASADR